jgi:L-cystine transport system permease protein
MTIDIPFIWVAFKEIIKALPITLIITIAPLLVGFLIGMVVALVRVFQVRFLYSAANAYVSFFRGTPIIMHIFVIYFGFPLLLDQLSEKFD